MRRSRSVPAIWFGWSGKITEEPADQPAFSTRNGVKYAVVDLKEDDYQAYYNGFRQPRAVAHPALPGGSGGIRALGPLRLYPGQ